MTTIAQDQDAPCSGDVSGWAPDTSICSNWSTYTEAVRDYATQFATQVLWAATGRRFGLCQITVRPVRPRAIPAYVTYPSVFDPWGGNAGTFAWGLLAVAGGTQLVNFADGLMGQPPEIPLPGPVGAVSNVTIDGVVFSPSLYRLDGNKLVREDGQPWPVSQDLSKVLGQTNTWSVTYTRGEPVPIPVNYAAGVYACEVAKARAGGQCALPNKVTSITRQGVSVQIVSVNDYLDKGLTGISDVDTIILAYNPFHARSRPRVVSQDVARQLYR